MGTRKFYVITRTDEGDGYNAETIYIGTNFKAAIARLRYMFEMIRDNDYENADPETSWPDIIPDDLPVGQRIWANINDRDCYYTSLELSVMNTGKFINNGWEDRYKFSHPDAKY